MSEFIEELLGQMTLEEKISLLAGSDMWHTVPIERLKIPRLKVSDGPNGARGGDFTNGVTAACFPAGISLSSTWNTALIERVGQALAQETMTKGARVLLAPTLNIHRSPLGGRNFESYSEDPYLTARMAVAYINGVQGAGIGATAKHYLANESEFERYTMSSEVSERALREIYLPPFQAAVQEAKVWAVMAAYNLVNGVAASEDPYLLTDILRTEWGFDGIVVSDWFLSVKSTAPSVNAGLDLEMPGPGNWRGEKLLAAVNAGSVQEQTIDASVRRLLHLLDKAGLFADPEEQPERAVNRPEHRALIREAAAEGIVLLKNAGELLPLQPDLPQSIAIIGPNAQVAQIMAGGSAQVNPHYRITPYEGITARVGPEVKIQYAEGCKNYKELPLLTGEQLTAGTNGSEHGLFVEYFNNSDLSGAPVVTTLVPTTELIWFGSIPDEVNAERFSVRGTARFTPSESGHYTFSLLSAGLSRLALDGQELLDNWTRQTPGDAYFGVGSTPVTHSIALQAGQSYTLTLTFSNTPGLMGAAVRLGYLPPQPEDTIEQAVTLAAASDVVLIFAGLNNEWDSEGFDRSDLALPAQQNELIRRVAAANKRTVVVLNTGSAVSMPWLDQVAAVMEAWYPGQECGNAIADVIFGDVNPSGKLPQTFPIKLADNPTYLNFPAENGKLHYGEGIFVGYRYYDEKQITPLFPFGFGLSYTTFAYSNLRLSTQNLDPDQTLQVEIDITNTGTRAGKEIVQLYIHDQQARLRRPQKELKAFAKVTLEPGERKTLTISLDRTALSYYDDQLKSWIAEAGTFTVLLGSSSQHIHQTASFTLTETTRY